MSTLIVEVCKVEEVAAHGNADRLERVRVKNWWCIAPKGQYRVDCKVVYVPPDAVLPEALAERWGIAKYCAPLGRDISGERPPGLRVRAARFRGVPSFGTIQDPDDATWEAGRDVREHYGITKYDPPLRSTEGDAAPPAHAFHAYTDIENLGNFPGVFRDGEEVVVHEKLHGTNARAGLVWHPDESAAGFTWQWMAGSHGNRRKEFNDKGVRSRYWLPFQQDATDRDPLRAMIREVASAHKAATSVIVFGEIFGPGVQDMTYGQKAQSFRVFDIAVDGNYLNHDEASRHLSAHGIPAVPLLYRGPYSLAKMDELVDGPTTVCDAADIREPFKGREGIVIKPTEERTEPALGGRAILKYVSADYHDRRNKDRSEDH